MWSHYLYDSYIIIVKCRILHVTSIRAMLDATAETVLTRDCASVFKKTLFKERGKSCFFFFIIRQVNFKHSITGRSINTTAEEKSVYVYRNEISGYLYIFPPLHNMQMRIQFFSIKPYSAAMYGPKTVKY